MDEIEKLEKWLIKECEREDEEFRHLSKQKQIEYIKESYEEDKKETYEEWLKITAKANGYKEEA